MTRYLAWLAPAILMAQVQAPSIGCFMDGDRAFGILGVAGSFVVEPAEACGEVENRWRVTSDEDGAPWLERVDPVSSAVEYRRELEPGRYGVWPDGTLAAFDALGLPGAVGGWRLASEQWMLLQVDGYWLALDRGGQWFYLPGGVQ
jgi:hypothetical protein